MLARTSTLAIAMLAGFAHVASAHNIDMEPQQDVLAPDDPVYQDPHPHNFSEERPYNLTAFWPTRTEIRTTPEEWTEIEEGEDTRRTVGRAEGRFLQRVVDFETGTPGWMGGVMTSRAIFAYLNGTTAGDGTAGDASPSPADVDVYSFTVTPADTVQLAHLAKSNGLAAAFIGLGVTIAIAQPIVPACEETRDQYPAIALTVPCSVMIDPAGNPTRSPVPVAARLDRYRQYEFPEAVDPASVPDTRARTEVFGHVVGDLPFPTEVLVRYELPGASPEDPPTVAEIWSAPAIERVGPKGPENIAMCVAQVAYNIPSDDRAVFHEEHTNNTWYLPTGCTVPENGGPDCDGDADAPPAPGIFYAIPTYAPEPTPGRYYVWNPDGAGIDYTLSSGLGEGYPWVAEYEELEERIQENTWTHHPCTQVLQ